jgi:lysozyme
MREYRTRLILNPVHAALAEVRPTMQIFTYSDKGLALTKGFEGLRLAAYQDVAGIWTIGYGHTGADVVAGRTISETQAETLLLADLADAVACVNRAVTAAINQSQFDAMVDFCFNAGRGNFLNSTLLRMVNAGASDRAQLQFQLWVHAGGQVVPGLVRRRKAEAALFASANQPGNPTNKQALSDEVLA